MAIHVEAEKEQRTLVEASLPNPRSLLNSGRISSPRRLITADALQPSILYSVFSPSVDLLLACMPQITGFTSPEIPYLPLAFRGLVIMEDVNASLQPEETTQPSEVSASEFHNLTLRLEALEYSVRYLEDNMRTRLSAMEERVEELMRRMDGYNALHRNWSQHVSWDVPTVALNQPGTLTSPLAAPRQRKKKGTLIAKRVIRRYRRLVKSSWDSKTCIRRLIKKIHKRRCQRS
ncbi:hypothetical protein ZIOFF_044868 [Zingiber officinale]|uniref:Uncharacterized protein n=2 Tax=Zingiber officinale TaxID=94328 RepID=A0A8J5G6W6_ZINOF|nr:hypothetical protein ZIOFF_044868 [Zingiber officinale]